MSKGSRFTALALGGLAIVLAFAVGGYILGFGLGEQAGERHANANTYEKHAQDEINSICAALDGVSQTKCIIRVVEATNDHERAEGALAAQQNMAKWALLMLLATVAMAVISIFGAYYVWLNLKATQDIGTAQTRPWLSVDMDIASDILFKDKETRITLNVVIKNHGNSPAVAVFVNVEVFPDMHASTRALEEMRLRPIIKSPKRSTFGYGIFPNQPHSHLTNVRIPLTGFGIEAGMITPIVICFIRYKTPGKHNTEHFTDVAMNLVDVESGMGLGMSTKHGTIPARRLQLQNGFGQGAVD
jgi:hypothetical protein